MAIPTPGFRLAALATPVLIMMSGNAPAADDETVAVDAATLAPISVTATSNPLSAFDYPGMVSVIDREDILAGQPSTSDDVLRLVPNVQFTGGPRRTGEVPSLRGFSGPDVIVRMDGARQNFLSGHDGRFFLEPAFLREAEVVRGPVSSLYGSGGTGGVLDFRTIGAGDFLAPGETAGVRVGAGSASVNDERSASLITYGRPTERTELLAGLVTRDSGDIDLGDGTTLDRTDDDIVSGLVKAEWSPGRHHELEATFQRFDNDAEEPNNAQGFGGDDIVDKDIVADTWRLGYRFANPANPMMDVDILLYRAEFRIDETRLDDRGAGPEGETLGRDLDTTGLRATNRSHFSGESTDITWTYGTELYRDRQRGDSATGERAGVPDGEQDFAAAFGQGEIRWREPFNRLPGELLLIPGIRYDDYGASSDRGDSNDDSAFSPRLGITYAPVPAFMVFTSHAEAFRAPTLGELYQDGVHFRLGPTITNRFEPSPDLAPQRTSTTEVGFGLDLADLAFDRDALRFKATYFRIDGEDFIDSEVDQPIPGVDCNPGIPADCNGTTRAVNVTDATLYGAEAEARYTMGRLRFDLGFSRIDGENDDTGDKLGVLTPNQYTLRTTLGIPELDAVAGWNILSADDFDRVDDPAEGRDGYTVNDVFVAWQPGGALAGLRVDAGIDNVFDRDYARVFTGAAEARQNVKIRLGYALQW